MNKLPCNFIFPGLYTSPHLFDLRERFRINGELVEEAAFLKSFWEVWEKMESQLKLGLDEFSKPGFFRFLTLLSFHLFKAMEVDVIVLEVGIGGRFDSTNVISSPYATGVTTLDLDHVAILGDTLEKIAYEVEYVSELSLFDVFICRS